MQALGKVALVTGAGSGLGEATAELLAGIVQPEPLAAARLPTCLFRA